MPIDPAPGHKGRNFYSRGSKLLAGAVLILSGVLFAVYNEIQPSVDYVQAPLFDGNQYLKIVSYLNGEEPEYEVSFPYNTRVLVPALVALVFPLDDTIGSFKALNLVFTVGSLITIFLLWRYYRISLVLMGTGFFWLTLHWTGILRLNIFDPVTVDLPLYLFQTLFMIVIVHRKWPWLLVLAPLATTQKESFLALMLVLSLFCLYHRKDYERSEFWWIGIALSLTLLTKIALNGFFPPLEEGRNSLLTMAFHLKLLIQDPFRIVRWLTATFVAFGGFLILNLQGVLKNPWDRQQHLLAWFCGTYLLFGLLAGGDMLRIVFLGFPFIMTLLLVRLKMESENLLVVAVILSLPLMKLRFTIPDPVTNWDSFVEWYPEYASWEMVLSWFAYGLVLYLVTLGWRRMNPKFA